MARTGVIVVALVTILMLLGAPALQAQTSGRTALAELKIDFPAGPNADKATFTLTGAAKVNVDLNLPVLTGKNKAWFGLINLASKQKVWEVTIDASKGPVKSTDVKALQAGAYRLIYEFTGEPGAMTNTRWSGAVSVTR